MIRILTVAFLLTNATFCQNQEQGIEGTVLWVEGNQMPGPGNARTAPQGVVREIYIYEPVSMTEVDQSDGLFTSIRAKLVKKIMTESDGTFRVELPPGEYSVFTKEENGFFANIFDSKGRINVLTVEKTGFTKVTVLVNYQAAY